MPPREKLVRILYFIHCCFHLRALRPDTWSWWVSLTEGWILRHAALQYTFLCAFALHVEICIVYIDAPIFAHPMQSGMQSHSLAIAIYSVGNLCLRVSLGTLRSPLHPSQPIDPKKKSDMTINPQRNVQLVWNPRQTNKLMRPPLSSRSARPMRHNKELSRARQLLDIKRSSTPDPLLLSRQPCVTTPRVRHDHPDLFYSFLTRG